MVRDLMIDMKEHDLLMTDKSDASTPIFDSLWGNIFEIDNEIDALICNIIVPEAYWSLIRFDENELVCRFKSAYKPDTRNFRIRVVALSNGRYQLFDEERSVYGFPANSFALSKNIAAPISASMLPFIDIDGTYSVKMIRSNKAEALDKAYIYSAKSSDLIVNFSDDQAAQLLSLCGPGNSYRYPLTGVGIAKYLNCVVAHSDLKKVLEAQFNEDSKPIQDAEFDNETGKLDVLFSPEKEITDIDLEDISSLDSSFFSKFTDDIVRRNIVLNELSDSDFIELLNDYTYIHNILIFIDESTDVTRIANDVVSGEFDESGNIVPSDKYFIVSATLEANTIIMCNDENEEDIKDAPVFIINDSDETRLYTALIEQPYWFGDNCHKCFILKRRSTVKYMIQQNQFRAGKGLFVVPSISSNLKNMIGLVQDENTGRLLVVISNSTNISNITLDEISYHIYTTQIN